MNAGWITIRERIWEGAWTGINNKTNKIRPFNKVNKISHFSNINNRSLLTSSSNNRPHLKLKLTLQI